MASDAKREREALLDAYLTAVDNKQGLECQLDAQAAKIAKLEADLRGAVDALEKMSRSYLSTQDFNDRFRKERDTARVLIDAQDAKIAEEQEVSHQALLRVESIAEEMVALQDKYEVLLTRAVEAMRKVPHLFAGEISSGRLCEGEAFRKSCVSYGGQCAMRALIEEIENG